MTDDLERAVKKLLGHRDDIERLKSGEDQEGIVRFLRLIEEEAQIEDLVNVETTQTSPGLWGTGEWAASSGSYGFGDYGDGGFGEGSEGDDSDTMTWG